jgi:heme exporter protein B
MSGLRTVATLVLKDLRVELRTKEVLFVMGLFSIMTVVLFHFSFDIGLDPEVVWGISAGMLWLAFAFSGVLGLSRSFSVERQRETLRGLLMTPNDRAYVYVSKLISNLLFLGLVEVLTYPIFGVLLGLPWLRTMPEIILVFFLASLGFAAPGTLFAAASANVKLREALLPVLLFPVTLPALIAGEECTAALLRGEGLAEVEIWLKILVSFDAIFVVAGVLLFEFTVEE